ncbi:MAG: cytidylate kinase family protein, partial [Clostridia bacterium]|nr:cytidylate kinase family protein [Clostridia bacterium]
PVTKKVARCMARDDSLTEKQLRRKIRAVDKNRSRYYSFYTGNNWGARTNYDLCINTTNTEIKEIVPVISKIFE